MESSPVRLVSLVLALVVLFTPTLARACSCFDMPETTLERCRHSSRVFAGTVDSYDWPLAYRALADRSVEIHLTVDTIWRGAVPARLVVETDPLGGPGSCTMYPPPGQRFVICDRNDGGAPPVLGKCDPPALGDQAEELRAALEAAMGAGEAPQTPSALRWPWWADRARLADSNRGLLILLTPFVAALVGAGAAALLQRWRPAPGRRRSLRRFIGLLGAVVLVMVVARVVLHTWSPKEYHLFMCAMLGPPAVAGVLGLVLAFHEQRRGRGIGGLALALFAVMVALTAGFMRLHLPVQPADVVACSEAQAREHLAAVPRRTGDGARDEAAWDAWERGAPAGCADLGLSRVRADRRGPSVSFADGHGGEYVRFLRESGEYRWELP